MARLFFALCLTFFQIGYCGVLDHLKKAEGKEGNHRMEGIDFIYMINLDRRPEKWELSKKTFFPYGIYPYRFSAVNGWELTSETISDIGLVFTPEMRGGFLGTCYDPADYPNSRHEVIQKYGQVYFSHCLSRGAMGIVLSHLSILKDAYDSGYETIWVLEDDVELVRDPHELSELIAKLDKLVGKGSWDILFTDQDTQDNDGNYVPAYGMVSRPDFWPVDLSQYYQRKRIGKEFRKIGARFGAYSMIVRRSGMKKIIDFIAEHKVFFPYDLEYYLAPGIEIYTVVKDIAIPLRHALSDNGGPNYLQNAGMTAP